MALNIPTNINVGQRITIKVLGSSHAGETVEVTVTDPDGNEHEVDVKLDSDGNGETTWTVPAWDVIQFNYSTCEEVTRYPAPQPV